MPAERDEPIQEFLAQAGWGGARLTALPGDASTRRYLRANLFGRVAMLMDQPQTAETPPCPPDASPSERAALGYNAIARLAGADCARFVAAADYLRRHGLSAPEILASDPQQGFVLMEDLGDRLFADLLSDAGDEETFYGGAIDALARLHANAAPEVLAPNKPLYPYDETALMAEIDLMTDWFFPLALDRTAHEEEIHEHRAMWRAALRSVSSAPAVFVHRDYHAQNLLWLAERSGPARLGVIDFQDAVAGARSYDLISLLEDARRDVTKDLAETMTRRYLAAMRNQGTPVDEEAHRAEMAVMAAQRNAKIAGIFARLFKRDSKPRYLAYLPRVWGHLNRDLEHPALVALKKWYDQKIPQERRGAPRMEGAVA